ncbi:MAG: sulfopyruvate decarboxylase subunit alpha [Promethearchaeota archaeon]
MDANLKLYESLKNSGIDPILSLPCIMLKNLIQILEENNEIEHISITREEEGVGIAAGAYLAGRTPALLIQNSGIGNSINAIKSLLELYEIPIIFIMSHRGDEGENIIAQIPMGQFTPQLLDSLPMRKIFIKSTNDIKKIKKNVEISKKTKKSLAILLKNTLWRELN